MLIGAQTVGDVGQINFCSDWEGLTLAFKSTLCFEASRSVLGPCQVIAGISTLSMIAEYVDDEARNWGLPDPYGPYFLSWNVLLHIFACLSQPYDSGE